MIIECSNEEMYEVLQCIHTLGAEHGVQIKSLERDEEESAISIDLGFVGKMEQRAPMREAAAVSQVYGGPPAGDNNEDDAE